MGDCDLLPNGDLVLRLEDFCIQNTAKRARERLVAVCLDADEPSPETERSLEMLALFLANTDFAELRTQYPQLAGGSVCAVRLHMNETGDVSWNFVDE